MEIQVDAKVLKAQLARHAKVLDVKGKTFTWTPCVQLTVEHESLHIVSTDSLLFMRTTMAAQMAKEDGEVVVNLKELRHVLAAVKGSVTLCTIERGLVIDTGTVKFTLMAEPIAYPVQPEFEELYNSYYFSKVAYADLVQRVFPCMERNPVRRTEFQAACFKQTDTELKIMATDGFRVACITYKDTTNVGGHEWLVPVRALDVFVPNESVSVFLTDDECLLLTDDMTVYSPLQTGLFPNVDCIVPATFRRTVHFNREAMLAALEQLGIKSANGRNDDTKVRLTFAPYAEPFFEGAVIVETAAGKAELGYTGNTGTFNPTFYGGNLYDAVVGCDTKVTLDMNMEKEVIFFEADGFYAMVMPTAPLHEREY